MAPARCQAHRARPVDCGARDDRFNSLAGRHIAGGSAPLPERAPMSDEAGGIGWHDLTVEDAPRIRDFYQAVV
ncbi:MAG TPA: hypothetical protein VK936_09630, partial [Longimicrobiales bacterium]|nr:hypothetical protein [Longimicrobiales bacterium]